MTLDELEVYAKDNQAYRDVIKPVDVSALEIRRVLFQWMGVKEAPTPVETERQIEKATTVKVKAKQMDAFIAAGMPSPAIDWLKQWEKDNG